MLFPLIIEVEIVYRKLALMPNSYRLFKEELGLISSSTLGTIILITRTPLLNACF